jgi:uncharacterized YccA/Bax inhibitor family protein
MMKSTNPAFTTDAFQNFDYAAPHGATMTVQGAVSKTFLLLAILSGTAVWSWTASANGGVTQGLIAGAAIGGLVVGLITSFKPSVAPWTAPVYAALEGALLGAVSKLVEDKYYPGIAMQAVALTTGTLFVMLTLYTTRIIRVTQKLRAGILTAMGALMLFYIGTWLLSMFDVQMPAMKNPMVGILFSLFVVGLAAFCLLLDFDMIEQGATYGAPKSLEWYGAFGLIVSLVWLYFQILRLLMRIYEDRR